MAFVENLSILLSALFTGALVSMFGVRLVSRSTVVSTFRVGAAGYLVQPLMQTILGFGGAAAAFAVGLAGGGGLRWLLAGIFIMWGSIAVQAAWRLERAALWLQASAIPLGIAALALVGFTCHQAA